MPNLSEQSLTIPPYPTLIFEQGALKQLPDQVKAIGKSKAFIVTDKGLVKAGVIERVKAILTAANIPATVFDGVEANPTTDNVAAGSGPLRAAGDVAVVAVGGGSSMDAAKAIALHAANGGTVADLDYRNPLKNPALPIIAIPTTAGTGSETNTYGVITNLATHRKFYVGNDSAQPKIAILDPTLTVGLPPAVTAATGMDVLTHALESLSSRNANPFSDGLDLQVIRLVSTWLPKAVANGADIEARSQMLLAAHIVAIAFRATGLGIGHAIGHSLGGRLNLAHGLALAIVLPDVLRFNLPVREEKYAQVAFAMGVGDTRNSTAENAQAAIAAVASLSETVGTARKLTDVGCTVEHVPTLVQDSLDDEVLSNSPRQPTRDEMRELILGVM
jgi:alcohol dehydrogenase